jgi:hypothetical protein
MFGAEISGEGADTVSAGAENDGQESGVDLIGNDLSVHLTGAAVARNMASMAFGRLHRAPSIRQ